MQDPDLIPQEQTTPQAQWTPEQYAAYQQELAMAQASPALTYEETASQDPYQAARQYTEEDWAQPLASQPSALASADVDNRISQEYAQMNTFEEEPKESRLRVVLGLLFAHKLLAAALLLSLITIGTLATIFVKNGGSHSSYKSGTSTSEDTIASNGDSSSDNIVTSDEATPSEGEQEGNSDAEATNNDSETTNWDDESLLVDDQTGNSYGSGGGYDDSSSPEVQSEPTPTTPEQPPACDTTDPEGGCYTPPAPLPPPPTTTVITSKIVVVTYHIKESSTPSQVVADIRKLYTDVHADVIAFQHMSDQTRLAAINTNIINCSTCVFAGYIPTTNDSADLPIIWNKNKFVKMAVGSTKITDRTTISGVAILAKYINTVKLGDKATGKSFYVLNNHGIATGETAGKPTYSSARTAIFQKQMDGMKSKITGLAAVGDPIIVAGTYYVNYRSDSTVKYIAYPYKNLSDVATRANWQRLGSPSGGTFLGTSRLVDYLHNRDHALLSTTGQTLFSSGYSSDHAPVQVTYTLKSR